jgi:hypothetical protein
MIIIQSKIRTVANPKQLHYSVQEYTIADFELLRGRILNEPKFINAIANNKFGFTIENLPCDVSIVEMANMFGEPYITLYNDCLAIKDLL